MVEMYGFPNKNKGGRDPVRCPMCETWRRGRDGVKRDEFGRACVARKGTGIVRG